MVTKIILTLLLSFSSIIGSAVDLIDLSTEQLMAMQKNTALVIDIRTEKEWDLSGIIPGSHKLQFFSSTGEYNLDSWLTALNKLKNDVDQPVILVCRSGNRSRLLGELLADKLEMKNVHHLSTGINTWIKKGHKITKN